MGAARATAIAIATAAAAESGGLAEEGMTDLVVGLHSKKSKLKMSELHTVTCISNFSQKISKKQWKFQQMIKVAKVTCGNEKTYALGGEGGLHGGVGVDSLVGHIMVLDSEQGL